MNPREIRSGPAKLVLDKPLRFRRRTRSNPCDFNEFLQALQSSETIRTVTCKSHVLLSIAEYQWVLLVKALGRIQDIQHLRLQCSHGSRDFHPLQAVADAVNNADSLFNLRVAVVTTIGSSASDLSGLIALANALREHTALQEFAWFDYVSWRGPRDLSLDPVLRALPTCPHLRKVSILTKCASADAMANLLQLQLATSSATELRLVLEKEHLLAVADEIRGGRCNVQRLTLLMMQVTIPETTEAVKAVASAIRFDQKLEFLYLGMGVSDEAGVALAEALTVNKTLRTIDLRHCEATLGAQVYEAFSAMLRINTSLVLKLHPDDPAGADERLRDSREQIRIEQRLNQVGRGRLLASRQTTTAEYVDALNELNSDDDDDLFAFQVGCLYSLLRLNPSIV
jgi:hypothetical protein